MSLAFPPDDVCLLAGYEQGVVVLWDVSSGSVEHLIELYRDHPDDVALISVAFWPQGRYAPVGNENGTVHLLDLASGTAPGREFRPGPLGDTGFGQLSYDKGMRILTATQPDKTARATLVQELGHSLLVQALLEEGKAHPQETLAQWLHDTEQQVPVLTHRLYPEFSEADVQLPELFDFAVTELHQAQLRSADVSP